MLRSCTNKRSEMLLSQVRKGRQPVPEVQVDLRVVHRPASLLLHLIVGVRNRDRKARPANQRPDLVGVRRNRHERNARQTSSINAMVLTSQIAPASAKGSHHVPEGGMQPELRVVVPIQHVGASGRGVREATDDGR